MNNKIMILSCHHNWVYFDNYPDTEKISYITQIPSNLNEFNLIKILNLTNFNLEIIPTEITYLKNLLYLCLDSNQIKSANIVHNQLEFISLYDNQLDQFPILITPMLSCLHIGKNKIKEIPYKQVNEMKLSVFLYDDNPFCESRHKNLELKRLESKRQKYLLMFHYDHIFNCDLEFETLYRYNKNGKFKYNVLKHLEETIYETYYVSEYIEEILIGKHI